MANNMSPNEDPILAGWNHNAHFSQSRQGEPGYPSVQTVDTLSVLKSPRLPRKNILSHNNEISSKIDWRLSSEQNVYEAAINKPLAVSVRNLYQSYEESRPVLSNLCMSVRKGTIYGLLGSSGCGKTTLLNCIVGLNKTWDRGDILVFDKQPGSKGSGIPGRRLGLMPQDTALYDPLSVKEMIEYYGRLYGMPDTEVAEQLSFLIEFLKLPSEFKLIRDLSGGQKRRVSLSIALVHSPELLILDEPTVGLDPVLRQSIWEYLYKIVDVRKTTVIITTHYIEEARFSNSIGVMRKGRLLVESSPDVLLKQFECVLLEQVVLKLCQKDELVATSSENQEYSNNLQDISPPPPDAIIINERNENVKNGISSLKNNYTISQQICKEKRSLINIEFGKYKEDTPNFSSSSMIQRIRALSTVMSLLLLRNPAFTCITVIVPTLQILLTVMIIGKDPKGMKIGIVNHEIPGLIDPCHSYNSVENQTQIYNGLKTSSCDYSQLSCSFITELKLTGNIETFPIQSSELAYQKVTEGKLLGYIVFPSNYSQHVANLKVEQMFAENDTLDGSRVRLRMDMTDYLGAALAVRSTYEAYENFVKKLALSCGIDPREFLIPLMYREPVYGKAEATNHDYIAPIIFITVIFELPMVLTAMLYISDRKQGTLSRARVAGLRFKEVMVSYGITQVSIVMVQAVICYFMMRVIHGMQVLGSMSLFFGSILLLGACAQSLGLFLGILLDDEVEALIISVFIGTGVTFIEGALWPLEAIPWIPWRILSYASPTTLFCGSFRSIVSKGLGLTHPLVWPGIAVVAGYTVLFCTLSVLLFVRKAK